MSKTVIYIAGPMRGYPGYNFAAFDEARDHLLSLGWAEPLSPADMDRELYPEHDWGDTLPEGFSFHDAMGRDFSAIIRAHAILLLPGWEKSEGACAELAVAEKTGKDVYYFNPGYPKNTRLRADNPFPSPPPPDRSRALHEAERLICGERNASYGSPTQNFQDTADVWSTMFRHYLRPGHEFTPQDVAAAMIALKLVRRIARDKADNWLDIIGYGACGYEAAVESGGIEAFDAVA